MGPMFAPGDLFVSLESGPVQWRLPDGTLNRIIVGTQIGTGEGMAFDGPGNLYVTRWCFDPCASANTVEVFNTLGLPAGVFGSGYDCSPHAVVFDALGTAYVGQAGCTGAILKFAPGRPPVAYPVAPDFQGSFWIDLGPDRCTMYYTSWGPNVKRYNVCAGIQLPNFNVAPLPGAAQDLRVLPDGGVLVSSGDVIARLNAAGVLTRTYAIPGEPSLWAGLDLVGAGTFWVGNYESSNVYRFDLATGAVRLSFNAGTAPHTVVGIRVKK
jgi:outer membrane protein assembly factor BamB